MATNEAKVIFSAEVDRAVTAVKRLGKEIGALEGMASKAFNFAVAVLFPAAQVAGDLPGNGLDVLVG